MLYFVLICTGLLLNYYPGYSFIPADSAKSLPAPNGIPPIPWPAALPGAARNPEQFPQPRLPVKGLLYAQMHTVPDKDSTLKSLSRLAKEAYSKGNFRQSMLYYRSMLDRCSKD